MFETENTARAYLFSYVAEKKKAVDASRAIGLDNLMPLLINLRGRRKVETLDKYSFIKKYIKTDRDKLTSFISPEANTVSAGTYTNLLGYLSKLEGKTDLEKSVRIEKLSEELKALKKAYLEYLKDNRLYDEEYEKLLDERLEKNYILIYPKASEKMMLLLSKLSDSPKLKTLDIKEQEIELSDLKCCANEKIEIDNVFHTLSTIKETRYSEVEIVLGDYERLQDQVGKCAKEYGIPVVFEKGRPLSKTNLGVFLKNILTILDENASFSSIVNLLKDSSLYLKSSSQAQSLLLFMIDNHLRNLSEVIGYDGEIEEELEEYSKKIGEILLNKNSSLLSIFEELKSYLLQDTYFEEEGKINELLQVASDKEDVKLLKVMLLNCQIAEEDKNDAIRITSYASDILRPFKYRFLINATEENLKKTYRDYDFLSDYERREEEETLEFDCTEEKILSYYASTEKLSASFSSNCYGDSPSLPAFYLKRDRIREVSHISNKVETEEKPTLSERVNKWDKIEEGKVFRIISGSNLDDAEDCLLKVYLSSKAGLSWSRERFKPEDQDKANEGSFIHEVLEKYFTSYGTLTGYDEKAIESLMKKYCHKYEYTTDEVSFFLSKYRSGLKDFFNYLRNNNQEFQEAEKEIPPEKYPILRSSKIDLITSNENGRKLFDIKTGNVEYYKRSKQLALYSLLTGIEDRLFFSVKIGNSTEGAKCTKEEVKELLKKLEEDMKSGKWYISNKEKDKGACKYCKFNGICRKEFFT